MTRLRRWLMWLFRSFAVPQKLKNKKPKIKSQNKKSTLKFEFEKFRPYICNQLQKLKTQKAKAKNYIDFENFNFQIAYHVLGVPVYHTKWTRTLLPVFRHVFVEHINRWAIGVTPMNKWCCPPKKHHDLHQYFPQTRHCFIRLREILTASDRYESKAVASVCAVSRHYSLSSTLRSTATKRARISARSACLIPAVTPRYIPIRYTSTPSAYHSYVFLDFWGHFWGLFHLHFLGF